jgi:dimethylargininase
VFGGLAVLTRPGAPSRLAELEGARAAVESAGLDVGVIDAPGRLDGGDVLKVMTAGQQIAYVGVGGRTDAEGVRQLERLVGPLGWEVRSVAVRSVLHLKSAVTALPDGTIIGHPDLIDEPSAFERFLPVPEPEGGHVVLLGDDRLMMSSNAPRSAELFRSMGFDTVLVDIGEFEKLEGCVTCLSVRIRG